MKISKKFNIPILIFVFVTIVIMISVINYVVNDKIYKERESDLILKSKSEITHIDNLKNKALASTNWFQGAPGIRNAFKLKDKENSLAIGKLAIDAFDFDFFTITDTSGNVFVRGNHPEKYGDNITSEKNVQEALKGKQTVGIEKETAGEYSIIAGTPIVDADGSIIGSVSTGFSLEGIALLEELKSLMNVEQSIFIGDTLKTTTLKDTSGNALTNRKILDKDVLASISEGKNIIKKTQINGEDYVASYIPLTGVDNKIIGFIELGENLETAKAIVNTTALTISIVVFICFICLFVVMQILFKNIITKNINELTYMLKGAAEGNGDLTIRLNENSKDEFGVMGKYFNIFIGNLAEYIIKLNNIINILSNSSKSLELVSRETNSAITETTKTVMNISKGTVSQVEDTRNVVKKVNGLSEEIDMVYDKSIKMQEFSKKVQDLNKDGLKIVKNLSEKSKDSIENSLIANERMEELIKKLNLIDEVSSTIGGIARQTNLLSLNAAIEAERSGEQGKGFKVVADEVKNLSNETQRAVKQVEELVFSIKSETDVFSNSVTNVINISNSQDSVVRSTEELFGKISTQVDAIIENIESINNNIHEMKESKNHIVTSIDAISKVAEDTASSTNEINAFYRDMNLSLQKIGTSIDENGKAIEGLKLVVDEFKV